MGREPSGTAIRLTPAEYDELVDPQWDAARRAHDWRNHVPDVVRVRWQLLDHTGRLCVWYMASQAADAEEAAAAHPQHEGEVR